MNPLFILVMGVAALIGAAILFANDDDFPNT